MGRHTDPDTLALIEWIKLKGQNLGFYTEDEYAIIPGKYYADIVWKFYETQEPIFSFQIETKDNVRLYTNLSKWFGTSSSYVIKPWRHFIIINKGYISEGHKKSLFNYINQYNISFYENMFYNKGELNKFEKELENLVTAIPHLLHNYLENLPVGLTLPDIIRSIEERLKRVKIGNKNIRINLELSSNNLNSNINDEKNTNIKLLTRIKPDKKSLYNRIKKSTETLEKIELNASDVEEIILNGQKIDFNKEKVKIVLIPQPTIITNHIGVPNSNAMLTNMKFRLIKKDDNLLYLSTENRNTPIKIDLNLDVKTGSGIVSLEFEDEKSTINEKLIYNEFINSLRKEMAMWIIDPSSFKIVAMFPFE